MRILLLAAALLTATLGFSQPTANFSWTGHCQNQPVQFTDLSTSGGTITSYAWKINHTVTFSTAANPAPNLPVGCVDVTLVVTDNSGIDSITQQVCIDPTPTLVCNTPFEGCANSVLYLDCELKNGNTTVPGTINWGDNTAGGFNNPTHVYANCTPHTVTFVSVDGCVVADQIQITPTCPPNADFEAHNTGNLGVQFDDLSTTNNSFVYQWKWDFGDGNTSNVQNPNHTYASTGSYTACLIARTFAGCVDTTCQTIQVNQLGPYFSWTGHCSGDVIQFTDESGPGGSITSWEWKVNGQTFSTNQNPTYLFPDSGCYDVSLTVTGLSETQTYTRQVCLDPTPQWVCDNTPLGHCLGDEFCVPCRFKVGSDTIHGGVIDWGDGSPLGSFNQFLPSCHTYAAPGTYTLDFSTELNGCTATASLSVPVNPLPVANYSYVETAPLNYSFTDLSMISGGSIDSRIWDFGDGSTSIAQNPTHTYTVPGTYTVCLTVTSNEGCTDQICYPIVISQIIPDFSWSGHCQNEPIQFTDESVSTISTLDYWLWKVNGTGVSNEQNMLYTFSDTGCHVINLTVEDAFESRNISDTICIDPTPELVCDNSPTGTCLNDEICLNCHLILYGDTVETGYDWGDGSIGSADNCHVYPHCGTYGVYLTSNNPCPVDPSVQSFDVTVYDAPVAQFTTGIYDSLEVKLTNQSTMACGEGDIVYSWVDWGDSNLQTLTQTTTSHTYASAGTYTVCLNVETDDDCTDEYCMTVTASSVSVQEHLNGSEVNVYQDAENIFVSMSGYQSENVAFDVFSYSGQLLDSQELSGDNAIRFNTSGWAKGLYIIKGSTANGASISRKVVVR